VHARASSLSLFLPSSLSLLPCCKHAGGRSRKINSPVQSQSLIIQDGEEELCVYLEHVRNS
jgi:hypothetical protein